MTVLELKVVNTDTIRTSALREFAFSAAEPDRDVEGVVLALIGGKLSDCPLSAAYLSAPEDVDHFHETKDDSPAVFSATT